MSRLNRRLGLFIQNGAGPAKEAFEELGLAADIESGELRGAEAVVDRLGDIDDSSRRAAVASQLFGERAGPDLVNLLNQGTGGIEAMRQEARDLGLVIDEELLRGAEGAQDSLSTLGSVLTTTVTKAILEAAPAIQELVDAIVANLPKIIEGITGLVDFLSQVEGRWIAWGATIAGIFAVAGPILVAVGAFVGLVGAPFAAVAALLAGAVAAWVAFGDDIVDAVSSMVTAVRDWLANRLTAVLDGVTAPIRAVADGFSWLRDTVVGNSIVPEMVLAIGAWFDRLGADMTTKTESATGSVVGAFRGMDREVTSSLTRMIRSGEASLSSFADFVDRIVGRILDRLIETQIVAPLVDFGLGLLPSGGGGAVEAGTGAVAQVGHTGGIAGALGTRRLVDPALFAGAPRFQQGGIVGLRPGEVPVIAHVGETILPRGASAAPQVEVVFNNNAGARIEQRETRTPGGGRRIEVEILDIVGRGAAEGRLDPALQARFGLRPTVTRR